MKKILLNKNILPILLALIILFLWLSLGLKLVFNSSFASGTDESINYVAFSAAKNTWADYADFKKYNIDYYYYPPLYFLIFSPFYDDISAFSSEFPALKKSTTYMKGGFNKVDKDYAENIPADLISLYRKAKLFSLFFGLLFIAAIYAAILRITDSSYKYWLALLSVIPVMTLPQFLYYTTLCNNDSLCNALSALMTMCFIFSCYGLRSGNKKLYIRSLYTFSLFFGLNLLTKTTALIFTPLFLWISTGILYFRKDSLIKSIPYLFKLILKLSLVIIFSGGWWLLYKFYQGDLLSQIAHRNAHPWAFSTVPMWRDLGFINFFIYTIKTYFALFNGPVYSIPDNLFILFSLSLLLQFFLSLLAGIKFLIKKGKADFPHLYHYAGLMLAISGNLFGYIFFNKTINAVYGRLLFPALPAASIIFTTSAYYLLKNKKNLLYFFIVFFTSLQIYIFLQSWQLRLKLTINNSQPFNVISRSFLTDQPWVSRNIYGNKYSQPLKIYAGKIHGFRVQLNRPAFPQIGAIIKASLTMPDKKTISLSDFSVADNDTLAKWAEFRFPTPLVIEKDIWVSLNLSPKKAYFPANYKTSFTLTPPANFSDIQKLRENNITYQGALCIAVLRDP